MVDNFEESKLLTSIHYLGLCIRFGKVHYGNCVGECGCHAVLDVGVLLCFCFGH